MEVMQKDLPPLIQEIAAIIGEANALRVVSRYGGRRLYFGAIRHDLKAIIGADQTRALVRHFASVQVSIPLCTEHLRNARNAALHARFDILSKTMSTRRAANELAVEFVMTERHVWRLLKIADSPAEASPELHDKRTAKV
jgi:hypothetical protein